ncbi:MAG: hypothetical protein R3C11_10060 [Planctomycetaceae bacterium]
MISSHSITALVNVVTILVHLWAGCCAHHDHATADHDHGADQHVSHDHHSHHHHAQHSTPQSPVDTEREPVELCEHGCCQYQASSNVEVPTPQLSSLIFQICAGAESAVDSGSFVPQSRILPFFCAPGARLHQPLEVWLI